jgi:hypothetical protein
MTIFCLLLIGISVTRANGTRAHGHTYAHAGGRQVPGTGLAIPASESRRPCVQAGQRVRHRVRALSSGSSYVRLLYSTLIYSTLLTSLHSIRLDFALCSALPGAPRSWTHATWKRGWRLWRCVSIGSHRIYKGSIVGLVGRGSAHCVRASVLCV